MCSHWRTAHRCAKEVDCLHDSLPKGIAYRTETMVPSPDNTTNPSQLGSTMDSESRSFVPSGIESSHAPYNSMHTTDRAFRPLPGDSSGTTVHRTRYTSAEYSGRLYPSPPVPPPATRDDMQRSHRTRPWESFLHFPPRTNIGIL